MIRKKSIYLDYAATTPIDPRVIDKMSCCLGMDQGLFANPSSNHGLGVDAKAVIEAARLSVANLIGVVPRNIVFTGGATESINLALKGVALYYPDRGKHIVTCRTEHKAVLESCQYLETLGYSVTYLSPKANGLIDLKELKAALRTDTILVSLMQVNNETGIIQDLKAIGEITRQRGIFFHVDAAQSVGKIPVKPEDCSADLLSLTAHKLYGPKGIGALYVCDNPRVRLVSQMHGGGQERKFRAGTLATHQIVGLGEACRIAGEEMQVETKRIEALRDQFWQGLQDLPEVILNNEVEISVPHILNIRFQGVSNQDFLQALVLNGLAVSAASACQDTHLEPSHVLQAMGYTREEAWHSLRFSFGRFTTVFDIEQAILIIREHYLHLRGSK